VLKHGIEASAQHEFGDHVVIIIQPEQAQELKYIRMPQVYNYYFKLAISFFIVTDGEGGWIK
jgi:hypothetical protein